MEYVSFVKKEDQISFFRTVLKQLDLNHKQLADLLSVTKSMIGHYLHGRCKISLTKYLFLCEKCGIKHDNLFFNTIEVPKEYTINIPKIDSKLAEFIGIILGDGYMHKNEVVISSHSIDDIIYLREFVEPLTIDLFGKLPKYYFSKTSRNVKLKLQSRNIVTFLVSSGLNLGNKIRNNSTIPRWIFSNKKYLCACIRGIVDTDGSVFPKSRNPNLPQIEVSSRVPAIRDGFREALILLGFKPSKWSAGSNTPNCGLYARDQVFKYYKKIGFNNPKHTKKFINIFSGN